MATINFDSLRACHGMLRKDGFNPTGCNGHHGHGSTVWKNARGESASITLNADTGCFVLYCQLRPLTSKKEKLNVELFD